MVAHFSSKLSHLAQSFRPQHHFNTIRNAFPSASSANSVGGGASQAAGTGAGGSAGGAGGAKWSAGNRAPNWGYQSHGRLVSQAPAANADSNSRLNDDEDEAHLRAPRLLRGRPSARSKLLERRRTTSFSAADRSEFLHLDEAGLSSVRVSGAEMQKRYRSAFSRGTKTEELVAMEKEMEADELDFGIPPSDVARTGRRASVSRSMETTPTSAPPLSPTPSKRHSSSSDVNARRLMHTSSSVSSISPFLGLNPPQPDLKRVRRNSTSQLETKGEWMGHSIHLPDSSKVTTENPLKGDKDNATQQLLEDHASTIRLAIHTKDPERVQRAVRLYLSLNTPSNTVHALALEALTATRKIGDSFELLFEVYNQFYESPELKPTGKVSEIILRALCNEVPSKSAREAFDLQEQQSQLALGNWNKTIGLQGSIGYLSSLRRKGVVIPQATDSSDLISLIYKFYVGLGKGTKHLSPECANLVLRTLIDASDDHLAVLTVLNHMENSIRKQLTSQTYVWLLRHHQNASTKEDIEVILESYTLARSKGLLAPLDVHNPVDQDELVWAEAVKAFFKIGEDVAAVEVLDRILVRQAAVKTEAVASGYPTQLPFTIFENVIWGFMYKRDFKSARAWFDKIDQMACEPEFLMTRKKDFYTACLMEATVHHQSDLAQHTFDALSKKGPVAPVEVARISEYNLARFWTTLDSEQRSGLLLQIHEAWNTYYNRHSWLEDENAQYVTLDAKQHTILALAEGKRTQSLPVYARWLSSMRQLGLFNHPQYTATTTYLVTAAALGASPSDSRRLVFSTSSDSSLSDSLAILSLFEAEYPGFTDATPLDDPAFIAINEAIANAYFQDPPSSDSPLSSQQYLSVISAFLWLKAASDHRGYSSSFDFSAIDNAVQTVLSDKSEESFSPSESSRAYFTDAFHEAQLEASHPVTMIYDQVEKMNSKKMSVQEETAASALPDVGKSSVESVNGERGAVSSQQVLTLSSHDVSKPQAQEVKVAPETLMAQEMSDTFLNVRPISPSEAFLDVDTQNSRSDNQSHPSRIKRFSRELTFTLRDLVAELDEAGHLTAVRLLIDEGKKGIYAYPKVYARLILRLAYHGSLDDIRPIYLLAYDSLALLSSSNGEQARAWVELENAMIVAHATLGKLEDVNVHRDRLIRAGTFPDAESYAALIMNMKETTDDAAVAVSLFEESQRNGVRPSLYLFNNLMSKLSHARRTKEVLYYFELMKSQGLRPSAVSYGTVISACCKVGDGASAEHFFQELMRSQGRKRAPPFNAMMQFYVYGQPSRERVLFFFDQMIRAKVAPTEHTYKLLLDAYGVIGEPDDASLQSVFQRLLEDWNVAVTGRHWGSLITAYGTSMKNLDRAIHCFESIPEHPSTKKSRVLVRDDYVYQCLLEACFQNNRPDLCEKYVKQMEQEHLRMTAYIQNALIIGYASLGNMDTAREIFESMEDPPAGVAAAGNHLNKRRERANDQSGTLEEGGRVHREPSTWSAMIGAELFAGERPRAHDLLRRVEQRAFPPAVIQTLQDLLKEAPVSPTPP